VLKKRYKNPVILHSDLSQEQLADLDGEETDSSSTYFRIRTVLPACQENVDGGERDLPAEMPSNIRAFHLNTNLNVFSFTKAEVRREPVEGDEPPPKLTEVEKLERTYVVKTFVFSKDIFPTTHRSSPVLKLVTKVLDPIENATADIGSKNADLELKTEKLEISAEFKSAFTMALKGIIDAAVNGGTDMYTQAFLKGFERREEGFEQKDTPEDKLVDVMVGQVMLLRKGTVPSLTSWIHGHWTSTDNLQHRTGRTQTVLPGKHDCVA
jgi:hypothetical protein